MVSVAVSTALDHPMNVGLTRQTLSPSRFCVGGRLSVYARSAVPLGAIDLSLVPRPSGVPVFAGGRCAFLARTNLDLYDSIAILPDDY